MILRKPRGPRLRLNNIMDSKGSSSQVISKMRMEHNISSLAHNLNQLKQVQLLQWIHKQVE